MDITPDTLRAMFTSFSTAFNQGFEAAPSTWERIAMTVISSTSEEKHAWLGRWPAMREWIGDRVIHALEAHDWEIKNRKFEHTVSVERTRVEDDRIGVYSPYLNEMGRMAASHPEELVYGLLAAGFDSPCYDGQGFFDTDHPVVDADGNEQSVSNMLAGAGPAWFLIDDSRAFKPLIFQERLPYKFTSLVREEDEHVFMQDEYLYGVRARANAGFALWQLAFGSKADLDHANYEAARTAMQQVTGDGGRKLKVSPTLLLVPQALEGKARKVVENGTRVEIVDVGGTDQAVAVENEWKGTAELLVSAHL